KANLRPFAKNACSSRRSAQGPRNGMPLMPGRALNSSIEPYGQYRIFWPFTAEEKRREQWRHRRTLLEHHLRVLREEVTPEEPVVAAGNLPIGRLEPVFLHELRE